MKHTYLAIHVLLLPLFFLFIYLNKNDITCNQLHFYKLIKIYILNKY